MNEVERLMDTIRSLWWIVKKDHRGVVPNGRAGDGRPFAERRWPIVLVCSAQQKPMLDVFSWAALTDDDVYWHDHSRNGGDIVCTGPFKLCRPICRCCPYTDSKDGHCGHTDCCWETRR